MLAELDRVNWQAIATILESEGTHLFLPLGIQIVGDYRNDLSVLRVQIDRDDA